MNGMDALGLLVVTFLAIVGAIALVLSVINAVGQRRKRRADQQAAERRDAELLESHAEWSAEHAAMPPDVAAQVGVAVRQMQRAYAGYRAGQDLGSVRAWTGVLAVVGAAVVLLVLAFVGAVLG